MTCEFHALFGRCAQFALALFAAVGFGGACIAGDRDHPV